MGGGNGYFGRRELFMEWRPFEPYYFPYIRSDERGGSGTPFEMQVVVGKRKTNRLNLDSEEEARLEAEEQARQDEIRQRKEEKRRRKEEEARRIEEEARRRQEQQQKYDNPETMLLEDSDSNDSFSRVEKKIRRAYPEFKAKEDSYRRNRHSES